jgi:hypothetical protein
MNYILNRNNIYMNNDNNFIHIEKDKDKENDKDKIKLLCNNLQKYILNSKNLTKFTNTINKQIFNIKVNENKCNKNEKNKLNSNSNSNTNLKSNKTNDFYCPANLKDKLFWCFYVIKMGIDNFNMLDNQHFIIEKEMKIKYIGLLRSNKQILKNNKIKPLYEIEDELANKDKIGLKTFLSLCLVDKINLIIIDNRKVFECIHQNLNDIFIINKTNNPLNYQLIFNNTTTNFMEKLEFYRENYFQWTQIDMKLKAITSYKLEDLILICKKLDINIKNENNKKNTKKEIYEILLMNF